MKPIFVGVQIIFMIRASAMHFQKQIAKHDATNSLHAIEWNSQYGFRIQAQHLFHYLSANIQAAR